MKAQLSIEFLLVFVAFMAFVAVFISQFSHLRDLVFISFDSQAAKRFSADLAHSADEMAFFSDGSSRKFSHRIFGEWEIEPEQKTLNVKYRGNDFIRPIGDFFERVDFGCSDKIYRGSLTVALKKDNGELTLHCE